MSIHRAIGLDPALPATLRYTIVFYLAHLLCQGWIASAEGFLILAFIAAGAALWRGELRFPLHPLYLPLLLYVAGSFVSAASSFRPWKSLADVGEWYTFIAFPLALALYRAVPGLRRVALGAIVALGALQSLLGLFQYFVLGYDDLEHRITGTTGHVMTYSGILLPISIVMVVLALEKPRAWLVALAALSAVALALTFTRGVWIGWVAGLLTIALVRGRRWRGYLVPAVLILLIAMPLPLFSRLTSIFDPTQSSNFDRIRMVQGGAAMIRDYPLLGVGPGNVKEIYPLYRSSDAPRFRIPHLHNNIVQIWAERGMLSLLAYLMLVALMIRTMWPRAGESETSRAVALAGIAVVVALFVGGLFEYNFGDTEVQLVMLNTFAILLALRDFEPRPVSPDDMTPATRIVS